jgi:uncharacterized protein
LNLRDIRLAGSGSVRFDYSPDLSGALSESVVAAEGVRAVGEVRNGAGRIVLSAELSAVLRCVCARCLREFEMPAELRVEATLTREEDAGIEDDGQYVIAGDLADLDEIFVTEFVLNAEYRVLCSEDCKGLCEICGADLNDGPCGCQRAPDPRLAVLGRLLGDE